MTMLRVICLIGPAALIAACAQAPTVERAPAPAPAPVAAPPEPERPAPVAAPAPLPAPPVTPATQQQAQKLAQSATGMLESGLEEQAKAELQRALVADPANKLALSLMRQINAADPLALLGRESFSYTVRPNDTMSALAGRFLNDIYLFYILARYNHIAVPRQLVGGQVLRIPGKAPPVVAKETPARETARTEPTRAEANRAEPTRAEPTRAEPTRAEPTRAEPARAEPARAEPAADPTPAPVVAAAPPALPPEPTAGERAMNSAEAAERGGDLERARAEYLKAATYNQAGAAGKAEQLGRQLVTRYSLGARTAFAKQDLDGAIREWDRVLGIDPAHETAKLERQRAVVLKDKVKKL